MFCSWNCKVWKKPLKNYGAIFKSSVCHHENYSASFMVVQISMTDRVTILKAQAINV